MLLLPDSGNSAAQYISLFTLVAKKLVALISCRISSVHEHPVLLLIAFPF